MMKIHPAQMSLTRYAAGSAVESVRRRVARHLADCTSCRGAVQATRDLRSALGAVETVPASAALFDRIVASRASGARVILPVEAPEALRERVEVRRTGTGGPAIRPLFWVALGGAAAIAAIQFGGDYLENSAVRALTHADRPRYVRPPKFSIAPSTPPAGPFNAARLRPMTLQYGAVGFDRGGSRDSRMGPSIKLVRTADNREWMAITQNATWRNANVPDTIWLDATTLEPNRWHSEFRTKSGVTTDISRQVSGNSLRVRRRYQFPAGVPMTQARAESLTSRNGSNDTTIALPANHLPVALSMAHTVALMLAAPLGPNWRGGFSMIDIGWRNLFYEPSSITITGSKKIVTPAGVFDCWEALKESDNGKYVQWYRKSDGLFIGQSYSGATSPAGLVYLLISEE